MTDPEHETPDTPPTPLEPDAVRELDGSTPDLPTPEAFRRELDEQRKRGHVDTPEERLMAARRAGWREAARWLRTDAARAALADVGALSISYSDRQTIANLLESVLAVHVTDGKPGTPLDAVTKAKAEVPDATGP